MNRAEGARLATDFGFSVFPVHGVSWLGGKPICGCGNSACRTIGKHPLGRLVPNGCLDASSDPEMIEGWWRQSPTANIAIAAIDLIILDVDPRNKGDLHLARLVGRHRELPHTARAVSGGGGAHIFFLRPDALTSCRGKLCEGVDVKTGAGAYVVAPPSIHSSGGRYHWSPTHHIDSTPIIPPPQWLLDLLSEDRDYQHQRGGTVCAPVSAARIESALAVINADDRAVWRDVGMALRAQLGDAGFDLWDRWSQTSHKYDAKDQRRTWASLRVGGLYLATSSPRKAWEDFQTWQALHQRVSRALAEQIFEMILDRELQK